MKLYSLKDGLKRARKAAGMTQKELADTLGIHIKTVMNWEQGIAEPSLSTLMELAELYHCDLDYLTGRMDCKTHDLQSIHDQTGLSEKAILKLTELPPDQTEVVSRLIEHPDFSKVSRQMTELGDKEAVNSDLSAMIIHHFRSELGDRKTTPINGNMIEKAMLYSLSNVLTGIICDITDTDL